PRHRRIPADRSAEGPLPESGTHAGQRGRRLLPDRRTKRPHLVRAPRVARLPEGPQLRRLVDRVGIDGRGSDRALGSLAGNMICHADPLNCETPLARLGDDVTPTADFYARNHFQIPTLELSTWRL